MIINTAETVSAKAAGFTESFNGKLRDECSNGEWFDLRSFRVSILSPYDIFNPVGLQMKKRFTEEQIIGILREAESAGSIREVCRN